MRYRQFVNARHRLAGAAIENIDLTGFGGLNQDRNLFALVIFHVEQHRLRRQIIVPDIMVNGLEDPFCFTGAGIHRHHGRAILLFRCVTVATPVIRRTVAGRQINQVQLFIKARHRPDVRRFEGIHAPFLRIGHIFRLTHIPGPNHVAVAHIEGADHAGRFTVNNIANPAAQYRNMSHDHRRRGRVVALAVLGVVHPLLEIDATVVAEVIAQLAGFGVQRQQARIDGGNQNPLRTLLQIRAGFLLRRQRRIVLHIIVADAATGDVFGSLRMRVKAPARFPAIRIQRGDHVQRRTGVERIANLQRRILIHPNPRAAHPAAGVVGPRHLQVFDVFRGNIIVRGKTGT